MANRKAEIGATVIMLADGKVGSIDTIIRNDDGALEFRIAFETGNLRYWWVARKEFRITGWKAPEGV